MRPYVLVMPPNPFRTDIPLWKRFDFHTLDNSLKLALAKVLLGYISVYLHELSVVPSRGIFKCY